MKTELQRLSRTEWTLMNICWRLGKSTARQVYDESSDRRDRDYQTVKTLLDRIAGKGYLKIEKLGPLCLYTPIVPRPAALATAIEDFTRTVLDNTLAPVFVHLADAGQLKEEELDSLRELLRRHEQAEGDDDARKTT
ncbi:MAG: BlaI/MecI/CopY family transcriptional regulator [Acidobacteriota bacterium]